MGLLKVTGRTSCGPAFGQTFTLKRLTLWQSTKNIFRIQSVRSFLKLDALS